MLRPSLLRRGLPSRRWKSSTPKPSGKSLVDEVPELAKIHSKLEQIKFEEKYIKELGYLKLPSYADKNTREIAISQPWRGGVTASDVVVRHGLDSSAARKKALPPIQPFAVKKKLSVSERLTNAREKSLDYTLLKNTDDEKFKEMMRDKLLGPEQVSRISSAANFGLIKGMADAKIEEAKAKGAFDNLPRGKPLDLSYNGNAYLDRTEYHLNNILKKQEVKLPWIEKQGSVRSQIKNFRDELRREWLLKAIHLVNERHASELADLRISKAKAYSRDHHLLRDAEWERRKRESLKSTLRVLNDSIRGYNLQAPMPSHIMYLLEDNELKRCYREAALLLEEEMKRFLFENHSSSSGKGEVRGELLRSFFRRLF